METLGAMDLLDPNHVHLVAGPMYHSAPGGLALYAHIVGATVVIMAKFDPERALAEIQRRRCTSTFMAPTLLKRIVDLPASVRARYDVSSMRAIIMAAAPCPMNVKEAVVEYFGPALYEFYGSSELGVNTVLRPEDVLRKPGSCGRAAPGKEIALLDDDGKPVPVGEPGELYVKQFSGILDEYYKDPDATARLRRGDWYSVGDVAYIDADGFYYICDRKRDMIISAGVNIYPAEVEDALHRHPDIQDVAVFGVPDDEWGERVHAAVQPRPGTRLTAEDVIAFARRHVAGYKVPREVTFHDDFPRDAAGKLLKRVLREPYWAGRATRV
jgi:acyl-CoA synthetase (AMP-forming)/AMP-acid ligase II